MECADSDSTETVALLQKGFSIVQRQTHDHKSAKELTMEDRWTAKGVLLSDLSPKHLKTERADMKSIEKNQISTELLICRSWISWAIMMRVV
jgi:hypothetical protein